MQQQRDLKEIGKNIDNAAQICLLMDDCKYCILHFAEIIIWFSVNAVTVCVPSGVGQSEFAVADMVDMFVLLIPPAGGDELQVG